MTDEHSETPQNISRRKVFGVLLAAFAGTSLTLLTAETAEAKPGRGGGWGRGGRRGNPPGWSRGRKKGWAKRGGPKWRW